jgi:lipid A 3-O-deacylase
MRHRLALLLLAALAPFTGFASDAGSPAGDLTELRDRQSVMADDENDWWGGWSDKYYTNGMRFSWTSPDVFTKDPADRALRRIFFSVGQEMYTPKDKESGTPSPVEHPYSGLSYGSIGYSFERDGALWSAEGRFGIIGPDSLTKETQRMWHQAIDSPIPAGWDNQLPNEVAANLAIEHRRRIALSGTTGSGFACDVIPRAAFLVGNIRTEAVLGGQLRAGVNLPATYGRTPIRQSTAYSTPTTSSGTAVYGYLDVQAEAVAFNYALDGTLFADSIAVKTIPWVGQATVGFAVEWDLVKLALFQSIRTEEFRGQDHAYAFGGGSATFCF